MAYSQTSIANLALGRIGARGDITDINDGSPNAVKVGTIWDAIFQEVLSERDWKFAKIRAELQLSDTKPLYAYQYAWAMPSDFLRFVRPHKRPADRNFMWIEGSGTCGWYHKHDTPVWPTDIVYIIETLPVDGNKYLLTDYSGDPAPVKVNYIRLITDYSQLMPGFVNALAFRLAMELSIGITEDKSKWQMMEQAYQQALNSAEAQNESSDYMEDESGSRSWLSAGRFVQRWW